MAGDDLSSNLQGYQIQLQQVEAALTNEPDNEELLKLKKDLQSAEVEICDVPSHSLYRLHTGSLHPVTVAASE